MDNVTDAFTNTARSSYLEQFSDSFISSRISCKGLLEKQGQHGTRNLKLCRYCISTDVLDFDELMSVGDTFFREGKLWKCQKL